MTLLTVNDGPFPEEMFADQANKKLILGLQHSLKNYKALRQSRFVNDPNIVFDLIITVIKLNIHTYGVFLFQ